MASGRQLDSSSCAPEQVKTEFVFKQPDLLAERWLRHMQSLGGPAEVQLVGDGTEVSQPLDVDLLPIEVLRGNRVLSGRGLNNVHRVGLQEVMIDSVSIFVSL